MGKLNQRKVKWIVKQWDLGELSHWKIAKQQGITKRHALRVYNKYRNSKHPVLCKPGRPAMPLRDDELIVVRELYKTQPMGATQMEKILSLNGQNIPHNRLHRILKMA